jgi:hypothetical protein
VICQKGVQARRPWIIVGSILMVGFLLLLVFVEGMCQKQNARRMLWIVIALRIVVSDLVSPAGHRS